jgi:hypothetical protein
MNDMETGYKLNLNVSIEKQERQGGEQGYWRPTQERLSVQESLNLGAMDFLGVMKILGQLHEAMAALKSSV